MPRHCPQRVKDLKPKKNSTNSRISQRTWASGHSDVQDPIDVAGRCSSSLFYLRHTRFSKTRWPAPSECAAHLSRCTQIADLTRVGQFPTLKSQTEPLQIGVKSVRQVFRHRLAPKVRKNPFKCSATGARVTPRFTFTMNLVFVIGLPPRSGSQIKWEAVSSHLPFLSLATGFTRPCWGLGLLWELGLRGSSRRQH
jgi:hypothetical protein